MGRRELLIDLIDDNLSRYDWLLSQISDDCLHWQPHPQANSIAVTMWHCVRVFDVFLTQHADGQLAEAELWAKNGWSEKTGYNPYGIGLYGWGTVQEYTPAEVAAIPHFSREHLQGYFHEVLADVKARLTRLSEAELDATAPGFGAKYSVFFWIKAPFMDLTRHLGECFALKEMWERQQAA